MEKVNNDLMVLVYKKLDDVIKVVGVVEGVIYIFDMVCILIFYVNEV